MSVSANDPLLAMQPLAPQGDAEPAATPSLALHRVIARPRFVEPEGPTVRVTEFARALAGRIRKRPLTALGVALGVGFLIGGALTFRAGRFALAAVARRVAHEVLKQVL
jgi:hypothetical protein